MILNCKYFTQCGGCSYVNYEKELNNKLLFLKNIFNKEILSIDYSLKNPLNYRNRMDFTYTNEGLSLRKKSNWRETIPIDKCLIADNKINFLLKEINDFFKGNFSFDIRKKKGAIKYVTIRNIEDNSAIIFVLNKDSNDFDNALKLINNYSKISSSNNILVALSNKKNDLIDDFLIIKGNKFLSINLFHKKIFFHSYSFFQNNIFTAKEMVFFIRDYLKKNNLNNDLLIDLYGGVGFFSIALSNFFKEIIIVENNIFSKEAAEKNLINNNIKGSFLLKKAEDYSFPFNDFFLIIDPPRSGLDISVLKKIYYSNPELIFYISCNPSFAANEIKLLNNHIIDSVAFFDQFPFTDHEEVMIILKRKE